MAADAKPELSESALLPEASCPGTLGVPSLLNSPSLGELLAALLTPKDAPATPDPWAFVDALCGAIADHYCLDDSAVWSALCDIEAEIEADTGLPCFGKALDAPHGATLIGRRVATIILGMEGAATAPPLMLSYH